MAIQTVEISVLGSVPSSVEIEGGFGPQIVEINQGPAGPSSTVDQTIIDGSANAVAGNAVFDALALKAPLASPSFTGLVQATATGNGDGINAVSTTGAAVKGTATTGDGVNGYGANGVYGQGTMVGVSGYCQSGTGVSGGSDNGFGAYVYSTNATALGAITISGTYHATFGDTGINQSFVARVKGAFGWIRGAFTGRIHPPDTLTADRTYTLPDATGTVALTTSNVATATALATSRNIFGLAFDGTANISGDATNTGHFASIPTGGAAGHFIMLQGTAPTLVAGRTAIYGIANGFGVRDGTGTAQTVSLSGNLTLANNLTTSGNFALTLTTTAATNVTLPVSGTLLASGGALGTPTSGTLTNCSALPVSTGISGLGTGVATLLAATPSGTAGLVGKTSPTFVTDCTTPILAISGTNAYTITNGTSPDGGASALLIKTSAAIAMSIDNTGSFILAGSSPFMAVSDRSGGVSQRMGFYANQQTGHFYSVTLAKNIFSVGTGNGNILLGQSAYAYNGNTATTTKVTILGGGTTTAAALDVQDSAGTSRFKVLDNGTTTVNGTLGLKGYTVATLPTGTVGMTAYVTDALAPTFLTTLVGGGAITTTCFYNGSNWIAQ